MRDGQLLEEVVSLARLVGTTAAAEAFGIKPPVVRRWAESLGVELPNLRTDEGAIEALLARRRADRVATIGRRGT